MFGRRRVFGAFRAHGTCLSAANNFLPTEGANSVPASPLAGIEGPLGGEEREGKGKEGTGKGKGRKELAKSPGTPRNKFFYYGLAHSSV